MTSNNIDWKLIDRSEIYEQYDYALDDLEANLKRISSLVEQAVRAGESHRSMVLPLRAPLKMLENLCSPRDPQREKDETKTAA